MVKNQTTLSFQPVKEEGGASNLGVWKFDQELGRKAVNKMIIIDELPFSFVECECFRNLLKGLQPRFKLNSRFTVANDCLVLYANEKKKIKNLLAISNQRICITTDIWTSLQNLSYMCLTVHFIDKGWKLHKMILNFYVVSSHKGKAIGDMVDTCLSEWGIDKLLTLTVDNASSNDTAISHLKESFNRKNESFILGGEYFHMRCCAYILNLIVKDVLVELKVPITHICGVVRYVRSSPEREKHFKHFVTMEKIASKSLLCLDVQTRWNSTYLMLDAALKFQKSFQRMKEEDVPFSLALSDGKPNTNDWDDARIFRDFLKKFYDATKSFSSYLYVTSNGYFHQVHNIERELSVAIRSMDHRLSGMAIKMKSKFNKYWGSIEKVNMMLVIAVVLDPRFKLDYVRFCYPQIIDSTKLNDLISKIMTVLNRIYLEYENREGTSSFNQVSNFMEVDKSSSGASESSEATSNLNVINMTQMTYLKHLKKIGSGGKSEVERYLEETICNDDKVPFDILLCWKVNSSRYKILSNVARDILAIPVSTVASESAFSTGGRVLDQFRSSLTPKVVEALICAQDWLRASQVPIQIEAQMDEIEALDSFDFQ